MSNGQFTPAIRRGGGPTLTSPASAPADGQALIADGATGKTKWGTAIGGGGDIDGGRADSVYTPEQTIDGEGA